MSRSTFFPLLENKSIKVTQYWQQLAGSSISLALSEAAASWKGISICVTTHSQMNEQFLQELKFFAENSDLTILHLPDWEILPYDQFSPHQDIISERLDTLYRLPHLEKGLLVIPISTLMQRLPPKDYLLQNTLILKKHQKIAVNTFRHQLIQAGYRAVDTVFEHGEFATRGSIVDLFPMGSDKPFRLDLFDNEIETLKEFDPETQRTTQQIEQIKLIPAKEFPLDATTIARFKEKFREYFDINPKHCPIYQDIVQQIPSPGSEFYLPLFFENTATLFDYLPQNCKFYLFEDLHAHAEKFWQQVSQRYESLRYHLERPILPPSSLFLAANEVFANFRDFPTVTINSSIHLNKTNTIDFATQTLPDISIKHTQRLPYEDLKNFLTNINNEQYHILFCAESLGRRESLLHLLTAIDVQPKVYANWEAYRTSAEKPLFGIIIAPLSKGAIFTQQQIVIVTESELFGKTFQPRTRRKSSKDNQDFLIKSLTELSIGDPIVHEEHGVGRYLGLQTMTFNDINTEFFVIEYQDAAKLYVPIDSLHLISRYSGIEKDQAPLNRLGTDQWSRVKRKALEKIHDTAAELLEIYAKRAAKQGFQYAIPSLDYEKFCSGFLFQTTDDQQTAIDAVLADMQKTTPLDRLICGDVGFGKTEVALRATFIATQNFKQVAILVPTTLLAEQHFERFSDRFALWPINIATLSRFKTLKEQEKILEDLASGKIDIIIGTHKLLQPTIKFHNLGLLIVDEEHRFGVRQKEKIKAMRSEVDILTLTATPIPRTLNLSLTGLRDLSIISTPPEKRLAVKTFVRLENDEIIAEAIQRELLRGGQVFYLHNEVKTIQKTAEKLQQLVLEARIGVAHGQMHEKELEQTMLNFYHKRFNVLVCTTIIETGIDIPSANTILIERADKLGLAQLHQLRGRVGRSHHQAYAYFFTPSPNAMTDDAHKRLLAITESEQLGSGFTLAIHDSEIRGTGELLGDEQSGHIHTIGFDLYMEFLNRAIHSLKSGKTLDISEATQTHAEINLQVSAIIPETFLDDVHLRLTFYKRIANAKTEAELNDIQIEMIDRFGLLPTSLKQLFTISNFKLIADSLGIAKIEANSQGVRFVFTAHTKVDPNRLIRMIQSEPQRFSFQGGNQLKLHGQLETAEQRLAETAAVLNQLT